MFISRASFVVEGEENMVEKPFSSQRGGEDYRVQGHNTRAEIQGVFKVIVHCMFEPPTSCVQSKKSAS